MPFLEPRLGTSCITGRLELTEDGQATWWVMHQGEGDRAV